MRSNSLFVAAVLIALIGCSSPDSYVVLAMQSKDATPIDNVSDVVVRVMKGATEMKTLTYNVQRATGAATIRIDQVSLNNLSVSFTNGETGTVTLTVDARDGAGCTVGTGVTTAVIKKGSRADASVSLDAAMDCSHGDGGVGDGGTGDAFPGCNPVSPVCSTASMTCQVNCQKKMGECTAGGTGAPGTVCQKNSDCMPGTQCFDYSGTGCNVKLCLRFCNTVAECAQPADGGVGPGSVCMGPVQCDGTPTAYHTCTFSCDPRAAAVASGSGCPTGLSCLVVGNMDQVDCACPEATRTKTEGQDCTRATDCAPGLICNIMSGTQKCRPVCRCNAQGTASCGNTQNDCPTAGTHCVPLTNDTTYGVCVM